MERPAPFKRASTVGVVTGARLATAVRANGLLNLNPAGQLPRQQTEPKLEEFRAEPSVSQEAVAEASARATRVTEEARTQMAADITDPLYSALPKPDDDDGEWRLLKLAPMLTLLVHGGLVYLNLSLCARAGQLGIISLLLCIAHVAYVLGGPRHRIARTLFDPATSLYPLGVGWPKLRVVWYDVDTRAAEVLRALLCLVHYFGVGMTFFNTEANDHILDSGERSTINNVGMVGVSAPGAEADGTSSWTCTDLLYFCVVIVSTVGYGHALVPLSPAGRVFTMFYSVSGFFALALIINGINHAAPPFRHGVRRVWTTCRDRCRLRRDEKPRAAPAEAIEPPLFYVAATEAMLLFVKLLLLNLLFCVLFMQAEANWSFVDAFYHCMMTSTTVGFGEVAPETQRGRQLAIVHIIASTAFFSELITQVSAVRAKMGLAKRRKGLLDKQLDPTLILQLDRNGEGVDKLEFVVGMLTNLGVVSHEDVQTFIDRFEQLDTDGSGTLDHADLAHMLEQNAAMIKAELAASDPMAEIDLAMQQQLDALDSRLSQIKPHTGVDQDAGTSTSTRKRARRGSLAERVATRQSRRNMPPSSGRDRAGKGGQRRVHWRVHWPSLHRRLRGATAVASRTPAQNVRRWARRLMGASACMVLNIFWVCLFGAVATLAGLVGAAAVGKVLGRRKLTPRSLRIATALALLCACLAILACALTLLAWRAPASYYRLDPIVLDQIWGVLDDEWHVVSRTAQPEARCLDWWYWHDVQPGHHHPLSNETFGECVASNATPWPTRGEHLDCLGQQQLDVAMEGGGYAFWSLVAIFSGFAFLPTIYVSLTFAFACNGMANLASKDPRDKSTNRNTLVKPPVSDEDSPGSSGSDMATHAHDSCVTHRL